jgi:hypothetical protein
MPWLLLHISSLADLVDILAISSVSEFCGPVCFTRISSYPFTASQSKRTTTSLQDLPERFPSSLGEPSKESLNHQDYHHIPFTSNRLAQSSPRGAGRLLLRHPALREAIRADVGRADSASGLRCLI